MAKYRVVTIAMAVKNNRVAKFEEFVDDSELTANPSLLIKEGFIKEVEEDDVIDIDAEIVEDEKSEKDLLVEKYIELTGKNPAKNISTAKLQATISELENEA